MEDYHTSRGSADRYTVVEVDDKGDVQYRKIEGLADEAYDKVLVIQPHGFSSWPKKDAHMLAVAMGNRRDTLALLGGEHPEHRPRDIGEGNAVLYDAEGNVVFMKGGYGIHVTAKKGEVEVRSSDDKVWVKPGDGKMVYLGGDGTDGEYAFVMTEAGPSKNVKAKV